MFVDESFPFAAFHRLRLHHPGVNFVYPPSKQASKHATRPLPSPCPSRRLLACLYGLFKLCLSLSLARFHPSRSTPLSVSTTRFVCISFEIATPLRLPPRASYSPVGMTTACALTPCCRECCHRLRPRQSRGRRRAFVRTMGVGKRGILWECTEWVRLTGQGVGTRHAGPCKWPETTSNTTTPVLLSLSLPLSPLSLRLSSVSSSFPRLFVPLGADYSFAGVDFQRALV